MPNEYTGSVVTRPRDTQQRASINEISPLTHSQSLRYFDNFSPQNNMETSSRNIVLKIIFDVILLGTRKWAIKSVQRLNWGNNNLNLAAIIALLLYLFVDPFERGFFCNDESLIHPYKEDTISTLALALVGGTIAILLVSQHDKIYKWNTCLN